ncbi:hypothetical protein Pla52o_45430 [Novipirellula galeiformis]|uniref:Uncharacterized protein n=1 Tax=Novipirellula galeiformis TaxID=2528004 RepID=A0A5C6CB78_9BACT|nr:hypothetical protein Pla52o_45430 [Novipirellula galeiformis]
MLSLIRPYVAAVLCSVVALGHAPAWLHVSTCHGDVSCHGDLTCVGGAAEEDKLQCVSLPPSSEPGSTRVSCSHGCHHHDDEPVAETDSSAPQPLEHHDHDRCPICQSLSTPCGFTWELEAAVLSDVYIEPAENHCSFIPASAFLVVAAPRGPPIFA